MQELNDDPPSLTKDEPIRDARYRVNDVFERRASSPCTLLVDSVKAVTTAALAHEDAGQPAGPQELIRMPYTSVQSEAHITARRFSTSVSRADALTWPCLT